MTKRSKIIFIVILVAVLTAIMFTLLVNKDWLRVTGGRLPNAEADMRYPYQQLSKREQALYKTLCDGIAEYAEEIRLPDVYRQAEYERVYLMICEQEPQFFYLDTVYETGESINLVRMHYDVPQEDIRLMQGQMDLAADKILAKANAASTDFDKLLAIHDGIAANCEYSDGTYQDEAYGCLVEGQAKCEGYSKAMLYVARRGGMNIMNVTGVVGENENHVWNIAEMDGVYYNFDVTWDDDTRYLGRTVHQCFALPDSLFRDHRADLRAYQPPECPDADHSYFKKKGLVLSSVSDLIPKVQTWVYDPLVIEFQFADEAVYKSACDEISVNTSITDAIKLVSGAVSYRAMADPERYGLVMLPT